MKAISLTALLGKLPVPLAVLINIETSSLALLSVFSLNANMPLLSPGVSIHLLFLLSIIILPVLLTGNLKLVKTPEGLMRSKALSTLKLLIHKLSRLSLAKPRIMV